MFVINTKKTKTVVNGLLRIYQNRPLKWVLTSPRETTQASDTSSLLMYLALSEKLVTKFCCCFAFNICLWSKLILLHPSLITGSLNQGINWCISILIIRALMKSAICNLLQANLITPCIKQQKNTPSDAISIWKPCFSISLVSNV